MPGGTGVSPVFIGEGAPGGTNNLRSVPVSPVKHEQSTGKMPVPPDLKEFGEYQILEELGQGGMGAVYKALHTKLDRVVAIKILSRGRAGDQRAIARFEREMKAVGRFDHPNIVRAYDAREIGGAPVLVMEFVEGSTLVGSFGASVRCRSPTPANWSARRPSDCNISTSTV